MKESIMGSTLGSSVSLPLNGTNVFFVVGPSDVLAVNMQREGGNDGQNDFFILRYLLRQNRRMLYDIVTKNESDVVDQTRSEVAKPHIYNSTLRRQRSLRLIMYRPQELMVNTVLNFVGFVSQAQVAIHTELEQELFRLDAILVAELSRLPGLLSYASLRTGSGTWYNLVLMNDDQVRSDLKQGVYHQYAAYQLAPQYYAWIRIHSGTLTDGVNGNRFEVLRTKYSDRQKD